METGGYSYEFFDQVPDDYNCPICLCVLRDPSLTECCGHNFCQSCIKRVKRRNGACPRCKSVRVRTVNNRQLRNSIATLKIRCKHYKKNELAGCGCNWIGTLESLERHLSEGQEEGECKFVPVKCQHGCNDKLNRMSFPLHFAYVCPMRPYQCEHCGFRKPHAEVITHYKTCPKYPVACPNKCCTTKLQRCHLKDHLNDCPLEEVQCELHFAGCTSKMKLKDVQKHMDENTQRHFSLLTKELKEQQNSNNELKRKYNDIEEELEDIKRKRKHSDSEWDDT